MLPLDYAQIADILRFLAVLNNDSLDSLSDKEFREYVKAQAKRFDLEPTEIY